MEAKIYSQTGQETGSVKLPEKIFNLPWNVKTERLVHQVVVSMMGNERTPVAHTKTRGEISGTGKKPWRQKGTGRARHGSRRSPIWVGGGVAHGPRNDKDYSKKINKKMKIKALFSVLSYKLKDKEIIFVNKLDFKTPQTREAKNILAALSINKKKNAAFIAIPENNKNVLKSFSNFGNLEVGQIKDLNILDILQYKYLVITNPDESVKILSAKLK